MAIYISSSKQSSSLIFGYDNDRKELNFNQPMPRIEIFQQLKRFLPCHICYVENSLGDSKKLIPLRVILFVGFNTFIFVYVN